MFIEEHPSPKGNLQLYVMLAADGTEGGRHNLIAATVGGGDLWVLKVSIGDKRWFKGANKNAKGIFDTFTVA